MGKKSKISFIFRTMLLLVVLILAITDSIKIEIKLNYKLLCGIKVFHIIWAILFFEMIIVFIPKYNKFSYCGKHLSRHYIEADNYNKDKLKGYTKANYNRALKALIFWTSLNLVLVVIYNMLNLNKGWIYFLFVFYYWADMFCVNVWCPFHKIIVKNKCCNECRIYNWGHIMYLTPLIFIFNFWSYSLVILGVLILLQWEYQNFRYPERFSPISNKKLRCNTCDNKCRFNKNKKITYK